MTGISNLPSPLREEDYEAIEAAVMETARGRWFLAEYTRRNRSSDTRTVLNAIDRLEKTIGERGDVTELDAMKRVILDVDTAISRAKAEICAQSEQALDNRHDEASEELDSIVKETEEATSEILLIAESIQETAWTMREQGADAEQCAKLDEDASRIYTACSFQDLTGQRTAKIVQALRYAEGRLNAVIDLLDLAEAPVDKRAGNQAPVSRQASESPAASDPITLEPDRGDEIITLDMDIVEPEELDFNETSHLADADQTALKDPAFDADDGISLDEDAGPLPTETFDSLEIADEALEAKAFAEDTIDDAFDDAVDQTSAHDDGKRGDELSLSDIEAMPEGQKLALFS